MNLVVNVQNDFIESKQVVCIRNICVGFPQHVQLYEY